MNGQVEKSLQRKLPVWGVIRESVEFSWECCHALWRWIGLGVCVGGIVGLFGQYFVLEQQSIEESSRKFLFGGITFLGLILKGLIFLLIAVFCHQKVLLPSSSDVKQVRFFFSQRERKYFAWLLGIYFIVALLKALIWGVMAGVLVAFFSNYKNSTLMPFFLFLVWHGPYYYILGRWILVFPAIALEQRRDIGWSWKQTKGNGWRMFLLVACLPLIFDLLVSYLSYIGLAEISLIHSLLHSMVLFIFAPVEVIMISIAFRELTGWTPSTQLSEPT